MTRAPHGTPDAAAGPARPPFDALAFLAEAERISNAYDAEACAAAYAPDATFESFTDGTHALYRGATDIARAWRVSMAVLRSIELRLKKRLVVASGQTLVNEWRGTLATGASAQGIEKWLVDDQGLVIEHVAWSSLALAPLAHPMTRLRLLVTQPRTAIAYLRATLGEQR